MDRNDETRRSGRLLVALLLLAVVLLGLAHVQLERLVRAEPVLPESGVVVEYTRTRGDDTLRAQVHLRATDSEADWMIRLESAVRGLEAFEEQR